MLHEIPLSRPDTPLLDQIQSPDDLKKIDPAQLQDLAREVRKFLRPHYPEILGPEEIYGPQNGVPKA